MGSENRSSGISINEIITRLKISRNYITRNITHSVKHIEESPSKGSKVLFDSKMLREYLTKKATFSSQTKRIDIFQEMDKYMRYAHKQKRPDCDKFLGNIPDMSTVSRRDIPAVKYAPTDFWDFPLIFPKEYSRGNMSPDAPKFDPEICYRDMFKAGAVKIQLGSQKTMFFIPGARSLIELINTHVKDPSCFLVPADWEPFYKGLSLSDDAEAKPTQIEIHITGESKTFDYAAVERALRKGFAIDQALYFGEEPEREYACLGYLVHIPQNHSKKNQNASKNSIANNKEMPT